MARLSAEHAVALREMLEVRGARTQDELASFTGLNKRQVARWIANNRKFIHVAEWGPDINGRLFVPLYRWGKKKDAKRPGRVLTAAQQMAKTRAARKAEGGV